MRSVPSAAAFILVQFGCAISRAFGKKEQKRDVFHRITFSEGLVPDAESSFLGLAEIQDTKNHTECFRVTWPMKVNTALSFTQTPEYRIRFEMDVHNHQDIFTRSYGHDVITSLAGGHVRDNRMVRFLRKIADPPAFTLFSMKVPNRTACRNSSFPWVLLKTNDVVIPGQPREVNMLLFLERCQEAAEPRSPLVFQEMQRKPSAGM